MSAIINRGENLILERQASIAQTKTQGGRRIAQKRGPTLYNLEVQVPAQKLNGDNYYSIENEVITLEYGKETFESASISGLIGGNLTSHRGLWSGTPIVSTGGQTGNTITVSTGVNDITNYVRAFDYIQFEGSTKVYQSVSDANTDSATGVVTITLNSPLVTSPALSSAVVFGRNVSFNFALMKRPTTQYQPGNIIQYGTFMFEEVIENKTRSTVDQSNEPGVLSQQLYIPGTEPASTTTPTYSGWVVSDGTNSESIASEQRVTFSGANGITTSYNNATNTITVTGATDNNTTYTTSVPTGTTSVRLTGTDGTTDDISITGGTNVDVIRTNDNTLTISTTAADDALAFAIALG